MQVSWFGPDRGRLTRNEDVKTTDPRFSLDRPYYEEWNLVITGVKLQDEGTYTCKVYTNPVEEKLVNLIIHRESTLTEWSPRS